RVKITDFGLARAADDASLTQSGAVTGTPLYMSPEQAVGDFVDQRSDLFSLGSVLYVMCSGRPPFRAATSLAVLKRVVEDQPRSIREIIPEVPPWLVAIIGKLHAKQPADRFASAHEAADLLARCLSELERHGQVELLPGIPPLPTDLSTAEDEGSEKDTATVRIPRARGRRRRLVAAAVIGLLLAGLGLTEATGVTDVRGTVIRLFSPDGTLVVEVDDPAVNVSIDGEEIIITGTGAKEIRLKPGQYKVLASKAGKLVSQELVTVTRNGRQVVRVSKEAQLDGGVAEVRPMVDAIRSSVAALLKAGATIWVNHDDQRRQLTSPADLRDADRVSLIRLSGEGDHGPLDDPAAMVALRGFPLSGWSNQNHGLYLIGPTSEAQLREIIELPAIRPITELSMESQHLPDAALEVVGSMPNLHQLSLHNAFELSDDGLKSIAQDRELHVLRLNGSNKVTSAGLAALKRQFRLYALELVHGNGIDDEAVENLVAIPSLHRLKVTKTRMTESGVRRLAAALPQCRIEWDGGVIEPRPVIDALRPAVAALLDAGATVWVNQGDQRRELASAADLREADRVSLIQVNGKSDKGPLDNPAVIVALGRFPPWGWTNGMYFGLNLIGPMKADQLREVIELPGIRPITTLGLFSQHLPDAALALLGDLPNLRSIELINAYELTDVGLKAVGNVPGLDLLYLNGCEKITSAGLAALQGRVRLRVLELAGDAGIDDRAVEHLARLPSIEQLRVANTNMTEAGVKRLAAALPQCRIAWDGGVIDPRPLGEALPRVVAALLKAGARIATSDAGRRRNVHSVDDLKENDRIWEINIPASDGKTLLANPNCVNALNAFPLEGWDKTRAGLVLRGPLTSDQLASVLELPSMQAVLALGLYDRLPPRAFWYISRLPKLKHLLLANNPDVSESDFKQIAALHGLTWLDLDRSTIDPAGIAALRTLSLILLHTTDCAGVDDAAIEDLAAMSTLKSVVLKRTKVTEAGIEMLAAALPQCRIEWDGGVIEPKDPDRVAADYLVRNFFALRLRLESGQELDIPPGGALPAERFAIVSIAYAINSPNAPREFFSDTLLPLVSRLESLCVLADSYGNLRCSADDVAKLADSPVKDTLTDFGFRFDLTPAGIDQLARFPKLEGLYADAEKADDDTLVHLHEQFGSRLKQLWLRGAGQSGKVSEKGWAAVCGSQERLQLSYCRFTAEAARQVAKMPRLKGLKLDFAEIDAEALKQLHGSPNLGGLSLDSSNLTDDTLQKTPVIAGVSSLELFHTRVTDAGVGRPRGLEKLAVH
ncbi:MAG TPA: protein kinase, partial [Pirellulales bacterium]|nr:protein kinase [Pirellulales bacterium]